VGAEPTVLGTGTATGQRSEEEATTQARREPYDTRPGESRYKRPGERRQKYRAEAPEEEEVKEDPKNRRGQEEPRRGGSIPSNRARRL